LAEKAMPLTTIVDPKHNIVSVSWAAAKRAGLALVSRLEAEYQVSTSWVVEPHQNLN